MARSFSPIGGQAVMEGVMMRNGDVYGLAVRRPDGEIRAQRLPWKTCFKPGWKRLPFLRGFPILLETLLNGIQALNRSASLADDDSGESAPQAAVFSLCIALALALGLFVLAPHLLSLLMLRLHAGGDVDGLSFHLWDGFFKTLIFVGYIGLIALVPDIRRVFQYHGAEHKTIHAFEKGGSVCAGSARVMSRLHPRCGTTFLLFVIALSIALQAILVPLFLKLAAPEGLLLKHAESLVFKIALVAPVSAAAYELIKFAAGLPDGLAARILRAPGLMLQRLTTREPDRGQLEVALAALAEALDHEDAERISTASYSRVGGEHAACEFI